MNLAIITAHAGAPCISEALLSWGGDVPVYVETGKEGMLPAYQMGFRRRNYWSQALGVWNVAAHDEILAYFHDDLIIHDAEWPMRVMEEFKDPQVGLVGFGGGLGHGTRDLYRQPYDYRQLAREDFMSNMDDAEHHGRRFTGACDVSVLDGFALIVRREILEKTGGWPLTTAIGYLCYDYWISCMTRRLGYRIRLVGVPVTHLGGQTFVKLGIGQDEKYWRQYLEAHEYIYNEFRDVLPARVKQ